MNHRKGIGMISRVKDYVTKSTLKTLYYSFIYPYLNYNLINWGSAASSNLNCLKVSNKKATRTILSKKNTEHSMPLFQQLQIFPLEELIKFKQGIFMWKVNKNLLPTLNQSCYIRNNSPIFVRQNVSKFFLPNPRTTYAKRHCTYSTIKLWNNFIPDNIKQSNSINSFKNSFKKHLLNI